MGAGRGAMRRTSSATAAGTVVEVDLEALHALSDPPAKAKAEFVGKLGELFLREMRKEILPGMRLESERPLNWNGEPPVWATGEVHTGTVEEVDERCAIVVAWDDSRMGEPPGSVSLNRTLRVYSVVPFGPPVRVEADRVDF